MDVYLTSKELAARLKIKENTLEVWRSIGKGPKYEKLGRMVRYRITDVEAWEAEQKCKSSNS